MEHQNIEWQLNLMAFVLTTAEVLIYFRFRKNFVLKDYHHNISINLLRIAGHSDFITL